jgi:hypothetical protein
MFNGPREREERQMCCAADSGAGLCCDDEGLRGGLFHAGLQPFELGAGLTVAAGDDVEEFFVP